MGHPNGYYTATKSTLTNGKQGKWYSKKGKKSDDMKKAFNTALASKDASHGDTKFTTNFTPGDIDTQV